MIATQNNFLGPAALIFSCCFPAKEGWESESGDAGFSRRFFNSRSLCSDDCEIAVRGNQQSDSGIVCGARGRAGLFGGTTLRVY
jgi:hypothetical protein